jgi:hypothetical protein
MQGRGLIVMPIPCDSAFGPDEYVDVLDKGRAVGRLIISRTRCAAREGRSGHLVGAVAVIVSGLILPGVEVRTFPGALEAAALIGVFNAILPPLLRRCACR